MDGQLILDRYRPLRELGRGGYGSVVLAWDTRMQRRVAIKRLPLPLDASGRPEESVGLTEARTAALLNHPDIVTVFDFDTDSDEAFLVMEHVDGTSLSEVLSSIDGPLTLDEAAAVVEAVADAVSHAHDNGVLHLDIKPENVLVTRQGRVKVADFGVATLSSAGGHGPAYGGTPGHMPPEQLEGRQVSARTDEWAFAVLVYELLTGENPFAFAGADARAVAALEPPPPSEREPGLPEDLDHIILTALSIQPRERYPDVRTFADALAEHLGDAPSGRASLSELLTDFAQDEPDDEDDWESIGLWDRLGGRLGSLLLRATAAVESGWLAWAGLSPLSLERPALAAATALIGAAGALAPSLGIGLGLGCLVAGVAANGAWLAAILLALGGGAWWWWLARRSPGSAVLPLAAPVLSSVRLGLAQPLLAGFALRPLPAAAAALLGGVLTLIASAATLGSPPYVWVAPRIALAPWESGAAEAALQALFSSPATYVALAAWPAAAAVMSLGCSRATRIGAALGAVAGGAVLAGGYWLADKSLQWLGLAGTEPMWIGTSLAWSLGASLILVLVTVAVGPPLRGETDDLPEPEFSDREPA
ncbi:MAG: serine/threonine-protein kinase [Coriobacteriia bacterium]|nr:serine/threonine-protein kinase [Coriobacteriia bacterium]